MVVLRATRKVLKILSESAGVGDLSDTALGDWYVNRFVVDRRPLLLFVSSTSLLAIIAPAQKVKTLPDRFPGIVADRLQRLNIDWDLIGSEMTAMQAVRVGRTEDRSVTGQMVDFAKEIPSYLPINAWDTLDLRFAEDRMAEMPCRASRRFEEAIFPQKTADRLLREKWSPKAGID